MNNTITIIGDVHGKSPQYLDIINNCEYSVQLGDLGYNYDFLKNVESDKHKFFMGNHDLHNIEYFPKHYLGRFGYYELNGVKFFFVGGGFSIDQDYRRKKYFSGSGPQTYFYNEELNLSEQFECLVLYKKIKPNLLICHEPPRFVVKSLFKSVDTLKSFGYNPDTFTTQTGELLEDMISIHKPKVLVHGHMHGTRRAKIKGIEIISLSELETVKIDSDLYYRG